jgi:hypothetical protein
MQKERETHTHTQSESTASLTQNKANYGVLRGSDIGKGAQNMNFSATKVTLKAEQR